MAVGARRAALVLLVCATAFSTWHVVAADGVGAHSEAHDVVEHGTEHTSVHPIEDAPREVGAESPVHAAQEPPTDSAGFEGDALNAEAPSAIQPPQSILTFDEWRAQELRMMAAPADVEDAADQEVIARAQASRRHQRRRRREGARRSGRFNYASLDCSAKVVGANAEAQSTGAILNDYRDSYMLNPCSVDRWVVIELCEDILVDSVEVANHEMFSSTFLELRVSASDRYPTRDWRELGTFAAADVRTVQTFEVEEPILWTKYVRLEFKGRHGSEFYCPVTLVRVYGTTMMEEFKLNMGEGAHGDVAAGEASADAADEGAGGRATGGKLPPIIDKATKMLKDFFGAKEAPPPPPAHVTASGDAAPTQHSEPNFVLVTERPPAPSADKGAKEGDGDASQSARAVVEGAVADGESGDGSAGAEKGRAAAGGQEVPDAPIVTLMGADEDDDSDGDGIPDAREDSRAIVMLLADDDDDAAGDAGAPTDSRMHAPPSGPHTPFDAVSHFAVLMHRLLTSRADASPVAARDRAPDEAEPERAATRVVADASAQSHASAGDRGVKDVTLPAAATHVAHVAQEAHAAPSPPGKVAADEASAPAVRLDEAEIVEASARVVSASENEASPPTTHPAPASAADSAPPAVTENVRSTAPSADQPHIHEAPAATSQAPLSQDVHQHVDALPHEAPAREAHGGVHAGTGLPQERLKVKMDSDGASGRVEDDAHDSAAAHGTAAGNNGNGNVTIASSTPTHAASAQPKAPSGTPSVALSPAPHASQHAHSHAQPHPPPHAPPAHGAESVFASLSNRIKALEVNMSLSSRYLESLSARYKESLDDVQKILDKKMLAIADSAARTEVDLRKRQADMLDGFRELIDMRLATIHSQVLIEIEAIRAEEAARSTALRNELLLGMGIACIVTLLASMMVARAGRPKAPLAHAIPAESPLVKPTPRRRSSSLGLPLDSPRRDGELRRPSSVGTSGIASASVATVNAEQERCESAPPSSINRHFSIGVFADASLSNSPPMDAGSAAQARAFDLASDLLTDSDGGDGFRVARSAKQLRKAEKRRSAKALLNALPTSSSLPSMSSTSDTGIVEQPEASQAAHDGRPRLEALRRVRSSVGTGMLGIQGEKAHGAAQGSIGGQGEGTRPRDGGRPPLPPRPLTLQRTSSFG